MQGFCNLSTRFKTLSSNGHGKPKVSLFTDFNQENDFFNFESQLSRKLNERLHASYRNYYFKNELSGSL